jgi:alkanesulfonate monooxygenase SsuD/methylene tetrahydromethanopterin reductase-like flavin-dependent oxidoreductase (luciferase family)
MSHTLHIAALDEAKTRLQTLQASGAALFVQVLTGTENPPALTGKVAVLHGEHLTLSSDPDRPRLLVSLTVLVPVNEAAADYPSEAKARRGDAEEALWQAVDGLLDKRDADPWQWADRQGDVRIGMVRPDLKTLCAACSATLSFRMIHDEPI